MKLKIIDTKEVWVAWTNTDCTEGRGENVPKVVCMKKATAVRLGKKGSVQGSDCQVTKEIAVKVEGVNRWLAPVRIHYPTVADEKQQEKIDQKLAAMEKAKAAGLTEEDIALLGRKDV